MHKLGNSSGYPQPAPQPQYHRSNTGLGCSAFARHYLRNHYCFLFLGVLRCFSSPRSPQAPMYSVQDTGALPPVGFPIRKSPGQSLFSGSPRLIAAYRVLHRLPLPRHPPYALSSLTIKKTVNQSILPVHTAGTRNSQRGTRVSPILVSRISILGIYAYYKSCMQLSKNSISSEDRKSEERK